MEVQLCDAVTDTSSRLEHQQKENYRQNTTESFLPTKLDSQFELAGSAKIICYCFIQGATKTVSTCPRQVVLARGQLMGCQSYLSFGQVNESQKIIFKKNKVF